MALAGPAFLIWRRLPAGFMFRGMAPEPGTYITHIAGGEVLLSREAEVSSFGAESEWIRLFDADMRELRQQP